MVKKSIDKGQLQLLENNSLPNFAENTCAQINKDLQGISIEKLTLSKRKKDQTVLESLMQQLNPILVELAEHGRLSPFVYLVDLNEFEFKKTLSHQNLDELSYLVIKREAQKVYLRNKFRQ